MTFGIIVGHDNISQGAKFGNLTEYIYNNKLAEYISCCLSEKNHTGIILTKDGIENKELVELMGYQNPVCAIELHCNAFNEKVQGTETLYTNNNQKSKILADIVQVSIVRALERFGKFDRGVKLIRQGGRGYKNLINYKCPIVLTEPFFIDNKEDCLLGVHSIEKIGAAISDSMILFSACKNGKT
jgi:N-acetylmuramoyl-L-alanine amidase